MAENIKKNRAGYGYKYADLAQVHQYLIETDQSYYQYIETTEDGTDYIMTVPIIGGKEQPVRRGCRVIQAALSGKQNPAQEQGSALTYARRYSLLMAFGLATEDDDAEMLTKKATKPKAKKAAPEPVMPPDTSELISTTKSKALKGLLDENGIDPKFVCKLYGVKTLDDMSEVQHLNAVNNIDKIKQKQEEKK